MPQSPPATSILELLTHPNPPIRHEKPKGKTNSRSLIWYYPRQMRKWEEFEDVNILKNIFGGTLLREACRGDRALNHYPYLHPQADCVVRDENDTRDVINKWNKTIVSAALDPVQHIFHPVIWSKGNSPKDKQKHPLPPPKQEQRRRQPPRHSSQQARQPRPQSLSRLQPDSGSVAWAPLSPEGDIIRDANRQERFPKEYKPSTKWKSESFLQGGFLDDSGAFERGKTTNNLAWPIRQAFTYCIQHMCRYGCILTCEEAFIFRIMPREGEPRNSVQDTKTLKGELINNGLMEYISIPWDNHSDRGRNGLDVWTVNLALWFVHILAGNNFEASWSYLDLADEALILSQPVEGYDESPLASLTPAEDLEDEQGRRLDESDSAEDLDTTNFHTPSKPKRKRESDEEETEEGFHLSFSKRQNI